MRDDCALHTLFLCDCWSSRNTAVPLCPSGGMNAQLGAYSQRMMADGCESRMWFIRCRGVHAKVTGSGREMGNGKPHSASDGRPALFIGKWTVMIMYALSQGPKRHAELRRRLKGISQRMLTRTLRNLESSGLIVRRITNSKPLAVEYALSKAGRAFLAPLNSMCHWAERHGKKLTASIRLLELTLRQNTES